MIKLSFILHQRIKEGNNACRNLKTHNREFYLPDRTELCTWTYILHSRTLPPFPPNYSVPIWEMSVNNNCTFYSDFPRVLPSHVYKAICNLKTSGKTKLTLGRNIKYLYL